jgi:hypothetical protein
MTEPRQGPFRFVLLILRALAAVAAGEATMVILITLVQESLFGGVSWTRSSPSVLFVSGTLTFLAAVLGGFVAGWIARGFPMLPALLIAAFIPVETTYLILTGRTTDPAWFDVMAASSLVVGLLLGAYFRVVLSARSGRGTGMPATSS